MSLLSTFPRSMVTNVVVLVRDTPEVDLSESKQFFAMLVSTDAYISNIQACLSYENLLYH